jgi:hypothetical protein
MSDGTFLELRNLPEIGIRRDNRAVRRQWLLLANLSSDSSKQFLTGDAVFVEYCHTPQEIELGSWRVTPRCDSRRGT